MFISELNSYITYKGNPQVAMICIILVAGHGFLLEKEIQVPCQRPHNDEYLALFEASNHCIIMDSRSSIVY